VDPVQSSRLDAATHATLIEPQIHQLLKRQNAMLPSGKLIDKSADLSAFLPTGRFRSV
jgi:hypothetical protein